MSNQDKAKASIRAGKPAAASKVPEPVPGKGNRSTSRGHRAAGKFTHADHAAAWSALAAEINAFRAAHPAPRTRTGNSSLQPTGIKALAEAMGMPNSVSTLRHMLAGTRREDSDGARIPGTNKIKAARKWLREARRAVA